ncbi:hypothetical protein EG829_15000 [bacterium]|nr:hypothetical protein [bacterium]
MTAEELTFLSDSATMAERMLKRWFEILESLDHLPDMNTFKQAIDILADLTAIRKTLIHASFVVPPSGGTSLDSPQSEIRNPQSEIAPDGSTSSTRSTSSTPPVPDSAIPNPQSPKSLRFAKFPSCA